jgi:hypothetical protein
VRVHTGPESAAAAGAVGAKAYTVGNDIHFAQGQYEPSDPFGMHLLAHEVAHTQQQAGTAPHRQNKLEVSTPGDAAELEADRAADAMVGGARFDLTALASAPLSRDYDNELNRAAKGGEQAALAAHNDRVLDVSTVEDKESAEKLVKMVESWEPDLSQALLTKDATAYDITTNNEAVHKLEEYVGTLQGENLGLSNFKTLYKRVQVDYARLDAMAQKAGAGLTERNGQTGVNAGSGTSLANDHIDNAAGQNGGAQALAARAEKLANMPGNDDLKAALLGIQQDKAPLDAQQGKVTNAEQTSTNAVNGINAARNGIIAVESKIKSQSLRKEFEEAKKKVEENKEKVTKVCEVLGTAIEAIAEPEAALTTIGSKAVEMIGPVVATALGLPGLTLSAEDEKTGAEADVAADKAALAEYTKAKTDYVTAANTAKLTIAAFVNELKTLEEQKRKHKQALAELGAKLDAAEARQPGAKKRKPGEMGAFQTITVFLGEADAFLADAKTCRDVGQKELSTASAGSAAQINQRARSAAGSLLVRIPNSYKEADESGKLTKVRWTVSSQMVRIGTSGEGSAEDSSMTATDGANSTVQEACRAVDKFIEEIDAYRTQLRAALGAG